MIIYRVVFTNAGGSQFEYLISEGSLYIGRSSRADVVLAEDSVSRRHARLFLEKGILHIEDLGSSNGVLVNGSRVKSAAIGAADLVQLGGYTLSATMLDAAAQQKLTRRTEIQYGDVAPIHENIVRTERSSVAFLYHVSQCLCTHRSIVPLLEGVLLAVMDAIPAERGYILSRRDLKEPMKLVSTQVRRQREGAPPLSHTLIDHVVMTRASVMTADASQDNRFENSDSIAEFQIKAVICVPFTGPDGVFGALYVDSDSVPVPLTQEHLQLLSIVGQIVGAGIQNIVLNEKQIQQERLAGIGETVSGTSHDMRNIMMGISGGTEMIEYACEHEKWSQAREGVRILRQTLGRLKTLADGLLSYARVTDLNLEETDLPSLVDEVLGAVEPEARKRSIDVRLNHHIVGNVVIDGHQMYRVLLNLVHNAMDAMEDAGGTINIESGNQDGSVFIRVQDSGCGIPPEHLEKIGRPFFTTKVEKGTGLGLATCYRIMEQHRGSIDVESAPDQGTTFTLRFPMGESETRHDNIPSG